MNPDRFRKSSAGRLLRVGKGEAAYLAFVPNSLPPTLKFDPELVRTLSEADRPLGELAGLGRTMLNPNLLIHPFLSDSGRTITTFSLPLANAVPGVSG